jgi:hypothetical protein
MLSPRFLLVCFIKSVQFVEEGEDRSVDKKKVERCNGLAYMTFD